VKSGNRYASAVGHSRVTSQYQGIVAWHHMLPGIGQLIDDSEARDVALGVIGMRRRTLSLAGMIKPVFVRKKNKNLPNETGHKDDSGIVTETRAPPPGSTAALRDSCAVWHRRCR
jgi:hypothetical protein